LEAQLKLTLTFKVWQWLEIHNDKPGTKLKIVIEDKDSPAKLRG
jgi:hypothetical protein